MLAITIVLAFLLYSLFNVLQRDFDQVPQRLANGSMINLNEENPGLRLKNLLQTGFYFEDPRDRELIGSVVTQQMNHHEAIDNIGELNKAKYSVDAEQAFAAGGESFKKRVQVSRMQLGFSGEDSLRFMQEKTAPPSLPSSNNIGLGTHTIRGDIKSRGGKPVAGALVRLQMIVPQDSAYSEEVREVVRQQVEKTTAIKKVYAVDSMQHKQLVSLSAYARTDASGKFAFAGLPDNKAFDVLPLQPGFQFGPSKGVQQLDKEAVFSFTQAPHKIRLLSSRDFNNLKKEGSLIVRTPEEATKWYWIIAGVFFMGFILLHIFLSLRFQPADQFVLPVVMLLVGLSLLTLLSLQDPLRDRFLARSTLGYLLAGFAGVFVLLLFDLKRFTADSGLYRLFAFKGKEGGKGVQWAALAVVLLVLTILLGTGPEGSGVKVNLFGFQPSEVVKFLVVIFLAGFFAANERFISEYAL